MNEHNGLICLLIVILLILIPVLYLKKHLESRRRFIHIPVTLFSGNEGRSYQLDLEEYLTGVVAAEMPVEFEMEALKAQAVAARTLAVKRLRMFGGQGCRQYPGVDFSDDPAEGQAWLSDAGLLRKWGVTNFRQYDWKIKRAVYETAGEIITFHNTPIDAVFHSTCGVGTAAASEVWHEDVPYLQSVSCGFDLESPRYRTRFSFTWRELSRLLNVPETALLKIKVVSRSPRGRILWLSMGKQFMSGDEFRKSAGLSSTCFTWKENRSGVIFTVIGYGHGVGMCQYGANGMAKQGWNYHQILQHYYKGIRFSKIKYGN